MEWVFVVLIIGAMIYAGTIFLEYTNYSIQIRPRIKHLQMEAVDLVCELDSEEVQSGEVQERISWLRSNVSDMSRRIVTLRRSIESESTKKQRIEIEVFKERLKGKWRSVAA